MRPVAFDYAAPTSVADAVQALVEHGDEAKVLGGGQSLLPVLKIRMADPETLVDLRLVPELREIRDDGGEIVVGAMATHHAVAHDPLVAEHAGVLGQAAGSIGDPQIRYRGTVGGALALDASVEIAGPAGVRVLPVADFLEDYFTTALGEDEVLTAIRVPKHTGWGMRYEKFTQVAQSWAIVAVAAAVRLDGGTVAEARIGLSNMGSTALRARAAEAALAGCAVEEGALRAAAASAGKGTDPPSDPAGTPEYRRHLAGVLAGRAVAAAAGIEAR